MIYCEGMVARPSTSGKTNKHKSYFARLVANKISLLSLPGMELRLVTIKRVSFYCFVSPVTGLAPTKLKRISQSKKMDRRRVSPRTTSVYTELAFGPMAQSSGDHGQRWGRSKVSSVKNVRSGKSPVCANSFSYGYILKAISSALVKVLEITGWGWSAQTSQGEIT